MMRFSKDFELKFYGTAMRSCRRRALPGPEPEVPASVSGLKCGVPYGRGSLTIRPGNRSRRQ